MNTKYTLHDTFNDVVISRHRTGLNALKAKMRHDLRVATICGKTSYIPKEIRKDGKTIGAEEYCKLLDELEEMDQFEGGEV